MKQILLNHRFLLCIYLIMLIGCTNHAEKYETKNAFEISLISDSIRLEHSSSSITLAILLKNNNSFPCWVNAVSLDTVINRYCQKYGNNGEQSVRISEHIEPVWILVSSNSVLNAKILLFADTLGKFEGLYKTKVEFSKNNWAQKKVISADYIARDSMREELQYPINFYFMLKQQNGKYFAYPIDTKDSVLNRIPGRKK